jgi:hypothetical protein
MNVCVRSFTASALVSLAALALAGTALAAQSAPRGSDTGAAFAAVGVVPTALVRTSDAAPIADSAAAVVPTAGPVVRGPSLSNARVASHAISAPLGAPPVIQNRSSNRNSVALMVVGGAALVVGAVIGDDAGTLVMLGGAAVGLYGLYLFLT